MYQEDGDIWKKLLAYQEPLRGFFHELGLELIVDEKEGWGYLEQQDLSADRMMLQLFKRRPLSFEMTMLLVILREELLGFDSTPRAVATVPTVQLSRLLELLATFVPEQNNAVRRETALKSIVRQGVTMGIIREIRSDDVDTVYQILRVVKAKLPEARIAEIRERLKAQPNRQEEFENGEQQTD